MCDTAGNPKQNSADKNTHMIQGDKPTEGHARNQVLPVSRQNPKAKKNLVLPWPLDDPHSLHHVFLIVVVLKLELIHRNLRLLCSPSTLHQGSERRRRRSSKNWKGAYAACGVEIFGACDDLRTIEAAGIWVEGHDGRTRHELGVCVQMRSVVWMCARVG